MFDNENPVLDNANPTPDNAGTVPDNTAAETTPPAGDTAAQNIPEDASAGRKYTVRYNHADVELTEEEMRTYAQKGMNYDHVGQELNRLRADPFVSRRAELEEAARDAGQSVDDYISSLRSQSRQNQLRTLMEQGYTEQDASELLDGRQAKAKLAALERVQAAEAKRREEFAEFRAMFPDVDLATVPNEVWEGVRQGRALLDSYLRWHTGNEQMRARAGAANERNAAAASPAPVGNPVNPKHYTREEVAKMSPAEVRKNYDTIMKSMPLWK